MTEENNDVQSEAPDQSTESPTLDDLYSEFTTQEMQTSQSAPQQSEVSSSNNFNSVPDPVTDSDNFTAYMTQHNQELTALKNQLLETKGKLDADAQAAATKAEEDAFNTLSGDIASQAGVDADSVAPHLLYKFVKDKNFQHIWQNRNSNPKAFDRVKSILANEMKGKVSFKTDSQLQENERAMGEAIKSASNNTMKSSKDDEISKMSDAQFDRFWHSQAYG